MRKRVIGPVSPTNELPADQWLSLAELADVEVTSESAEHPIESALLQGDASGWRASTPGEQTIRLLFSRPTPLRRIALRFVERDVERMQEYVVRWSPDHGRSFHDVVRQQWNFSPRGSTEEIDDYRVDLPAVTVLELSIVPDKSNGRALASLAQLRVA
jgi:hypothetical protein